MLKPMSKLRTIIVEDEQLAVALLTKYLQTDERIEVVGTFDNGYSGLKAIQDLKPDLVLLDIELPKLTGLELLELLDNPPLIIFTTAYNQYAIEAFEKNAIDYLLKPYSKERLRGAIDKAAEKLQTKTSIQPDIHELMSNIQSNEGKQPDRIAVKDKNDIHLIALDDVLFIEAQDDYIDIHTKDRSFLKNGRLKFFEDNLDSSKFVRVHRSFIVNTAFIRKLENYNKNSYQLILTNGSKINISRSGLQLLRKVLYI
jgi:two-component system LytT family response regulator